MTDVARLSVMRADLDRSTVELAGRVFPAALVICPPEEWSGPERDEWSRSLGGGSRLTTEAILPAENGVLFDVETNERGGLLALSMHARTCERAEDGFAVAPEPPWIWLPHRVGLVDGDLVVGYLGTWEWRNAEPEWVVETIDRLSHKPFEQPDGPLVRLVPLSYFGDARAH